MNHSVIFSCFRFILYYKMYFRCCCRSPVGWNRLAGVLPSELRQAPIRKLVLEHNKLDGSCLDNLLGLGGGSVLNAQRAMSLKSTPLGSYCHTLDLSNNRLRSIPRALFELLRLEECRLSFNQLAAGAADDGMATPWPRLKLCKRLDLSNNKCERLGGIPWMTSLEFLDVSHNEIRRVPEELGASGEQLRSVLVDGNPQRVINAGVIGEGGAAVKAWLKRRLPDGYERPPHATEDAPEADPCALSLEPPPPKERSRQEVEAELATVEAEARAIQKMIDNYSGSSSGKAGLKKDLAKKRSAAKKLTASLV
jgi:Leucine-rich repeat (LRR) protein